MSRFDLGWYSKDYLSGDDLGLAKYAVSEERGLIDQDYAKNGFVTTTLYPNDMFFVMFHNKKPAKKYFNSLNASVVQIVNGEVRLIYQRPEDNWKPHPKASTKGIEGEDDE